MLSCTIASAITFDKFIRKRLKTVKTAVAAATTGVSQGSGRRRPRRGVHRGRQDGRLATAAFIGR